MIDRHREDKVTLRWGIVGAGLISSWFASDLLIARDDSNVHHIIHAIGTSTIEKGQSFARKYLPDMEPVIYNSYAGIYNDPQVDVVYIGTPHAFHKRNCLDAIAAGKHVLCEKPLGMNAREVREIITAARNKNVFLMEGMWLRFRPLVSDLRKTIFEDKAIGEIKRVFCDLGMDMDLSTLSETSRLKNPALGAGSLLDIGIYSINWAFLCADSEDQGMSKEQPKVLAIQKLADGVDVSSTVLLQYPLSGQQAILSSSLEIKTDRIFCRIEGSAGHITVSGLTGSWPESFALYRRNLSPENGEPLAFNKFEKEFKYTHKGMGFFYEADAVALEIAAGRFESSVMPLEATLKVMEIMDEVRKQGGARFPQDDD